MIEQARRARRLAQGVHDQRTAERLLSYAIELEANAALLQQESPATAPVQPAPMVVHQQQQPQQQAEAPDKPKEHSDQDC